MALTSCCCSCDAIGDVLIWGFVVDDGILPTLLRSLGATVTVVTTEPGSVEGTLPADLDGYQMIFLMPIGSSTDSLFAAGDVERLQAWFGGGCKRLILVSDNSNSQGPTDPDRNDLLNAIGSDIRHDVDRTVNLDDDLDPGIVIAHAFTDGVTAICHTAVGGLVGGIDTTFLCFTNDLLSGAPVPWIATEKIGRSSLVVVADFNAMSGNAPYSACASADNTPFISNLFTVLIDDA